jgi:hypothetical protein
MLFRVAVLKFIWRRHLMAENSGQMNDCLLLKIWVRLAWYSLYIPTLTTKEIEFSAQVATQALNEASQKK